MADVRVLASIAGIGVEAWRELFPNAIENFEYLLAVEAAGLDGFHWRYLLVEENGRAIAAAPAFVTDYALDTTLTSDGKRLAGAIRRLLPSALTVRLACIGSPCTETAPLGFASGLDGHGRERALGLLLDAFEGMAAREGCTLFAVKDVPSCDESMWGRVASPLGYRPVPGLPVAHLDIDFNSIDDYLARLSPGTRRDMRRKLRALGQTRIEIRHDLDGVLERVVSLYAQTRARAEMQFESLTPAYFTGVPAYMGRRAFYVLYYRGDELLAANLLLHGADTLLDKFFCMDAERGRALNLYFVSWFTNVGICLDRGLARYQSGQAAYHNKLRLGSALTRTAMHFRHRNPLLNAALRLAAPLFAVDPTLEYAAA